MKPREFNTLFEDCARNTGGQKFLNYVSKSVGLDKLYGVFNIEHMDYARGVGFSRALSRVLYDVYSKTTPKISLES